jgi:DUF971 family protein
MEARDPQPTEITVHNVSRALEVVFDDGHRFRLPFEFLRVYSPSAEVRGHGPGQQTLQTGKREVLITALDPIGHYAVKPTFSDGHDTGIYSWPYLYELGREHAQLWADYLVQLERAGASRDPQPASGAPSGGGPRHGGGCGH